jgi:predicted nucleotidyltransferase
MKEMKMLDLDRIDLPQLCHALEDHSELTSWWLDPKTGGLHMFGDSMWDGEDVDEDFEPPEGFRGVEPLDSRESYRDLEDFTAMVRDPKQRELLERAIAGRGAFRRFKDTLAEFPGLRAAWFKFHDTRMERRAIEWLRDEGVVSDEAAEHALVARPDPDLPEASGPFDARAIARAAAADLRVLYGTRLRKVVLFGSWARGDAHPESDIDLLVVLDEANDRAAEHRRMNPILDRHSLENDTVVTALIVTEADFKHRQWPALIRARAEGEPVA